MCTVHYNRTDNYRQWNAVGSPDGNILHTVHAPCHPTLQHHNSYNRTDNYRQWNAVGSPDGGHKDARNMLRYY